MTKDIIDPPPMPYKPKISKTFSTKRQGNILLVTEYYPACEDCICGYIEEVLFDWKIHSKNKIIKDDKRKTIEEITWIFIPRK